MQPRAIAALLPLLLTAACWAPGPVAMAPPPRVSLPEPLALLVLPGTVEAAVAPGPPVAAGEAAARAGAAAMLGPLAGVIGGGWVCSAGSSSSEAGAAALLICGPVGAIVGGVAGLATGAGILADSTASEAELRARTARAAALMAPSRLAACLRETLLQRAAGRLVPGAPDAAEALEVRLVAVTLAPPSGRSGLRPVLVLGIKAESRLRGIARPADAVAWSPPLPGGTWDYRSEQRGLSDWTARDAAAVASALDVGLGVLAQRILADTFPGAVAAPAADGRHEALRVACRPPAPSVTPP